MTVWVVLVPGGVVLVPERTLLSFELPNKVQPKEETEMAKCCEAASL